MLTQGVVYQMELDGNQFIDDAYVKISLIRLIVNLCVQTMMAAKATSCSLKQIQVIAKLLQLRPVPKVAKDHLTSIFNSLIQKLNVYMGTDGGREVASSKQAYYNIMFLMGQKK